MPTKASDCERAAVASPRNSPDSVIEGTETSSDRGNMDSAGTAWNPQTIAAETQDASIDHSERDSSEIDSFLAGDSFQRTGRNDVMRVSRLTLVTLRDVPADAEIPSHQLLVRGGTPTRRIRTIPPSR